MNLYKVTCNSMYSSFSFYVIADNPGYAEVVALKNMKILGYQYTDYDVSNIELLASTNIYKAQHLLVLQGEQ